MKQTYKNEINYKIKNPIFIKSYYPLNFAILMLFLLIYATSLSTAANLERLKVYFYVVIAITPIANLLFYKFDQYYRYYTAILWIIDDKVYIKKMDKIQEFNMDIIDALVVKQKYDDDPYPDPDWEFYIKYNETEKYEIQSFNKEVIVENASAIADMLQMKLSYET